MRKRQHKYSVSVTGDLYRKVVAYANAWHVSQAQVLAIVLDNVLGTKTVTEQLAWYAQDKKVARLGPFKDPKSAYLACVDRGGVADKISVWAEDATWEASK